MIKINLLTSFGTSSSEVLQQIDDQKNIQITFIKKISVMLLGILALFIYEQYTVPKLTEEQRTLQAQLTELSTFNLKKEDLKVEIEKYENDRIRLNRQTEFLQKIQRERALSVQFLQKIKKLIPQGVWLTSIKVEGLQIEIKGESDSEKEVNDFNMKLAGLNFLKDVIVLSIELKPAAPTVRVPIKTFEMKAQFVNSVDLSTPNEASL